MIWRRNRKRDVGQGLVEFGLVLPLLLLVLVGMAEFGRIFAIYTGLFNAAREGTRYGVVHPHDTDGILSAAQAKVVLIDPADVETLVRFDSGPGTPNKDSTFVTVGDRVLVYMYYEVEPMLPLLRPLLQNLYVETQAARTISSIGEGAFPTPATAVPTATIPGTETPEPTGTPVTTPTPTPLPDTPIHIDTPLREGDMTVGGTAHPGQTVSLRDIQNPTISLSETVDGNGRFLFRLSSGLVAGHVIVVQGYGKADWTIVQAIGTPTPTATVSPTPTFTPTPGNMDILLEPACGPLGSSTVTVRGYNWPNNDVSIRYTCPSGTTEVAYVRKQDFTTNFVVDVTIDAAQAGVHSIEALYKDGVSWVSGDTESFEVPCPSPPTPTLTPTPSYPNLIVDSVGLSTGGPISTHDPVTFTVSVRNIGEMAANNLFWVDLYVDPASPISPTNPLAQTSTDWTAVSSLEAATSISLTLYYHQGFDTVGEHVAYVMADTWDQIAEDNEWDNVSVPLTITVNEEGVPPTPTPTPTPGPVEDGSISGSTWLYINGDVVSQGRVNVYCYQGDMRIAEALSTQEGAYVLENVPPGTYAIVGEAVINSVLYTDVVMDVVVTSGQETPYVTLILH